MFLQTRTTVNLNGYRRYRSGIIPGLQGDVFVCISVQVISEINGYSPAAGDQHLHLRLNGNVNKRCTCLSCWKCKNNSWHRSCMFWCEFVCDGLILTSMAYQSENIVRSSLCKVYYELMHRYLHTINLMFDLCVESNFLHTSIMITWLAVRTRSATLYQRASFITKLSSQLILVISKSKYEFPKQKQSTPISVLLHNCSPAGGVNVQHM